MPETRGIPDEEPTRTERATNIAITALAGQGIVRRVVLYVAAFLLIVSPFPAAAVLPLVLLMATDGALA